MSKIEYKEFNIEYVYNKKLKNSYISVEADKKIRVKSPIKSHQYVLELLKEREEWIRKQFHKIEQQISLKVNLEDEVAFFGEIYSIDSAETKYLRDKLEKVKLDDEKKTLKCYDDFYKYVAKEYLKSRAEYFSKEMNLEYSELKYRKMKSRWGSCSSKKVITFNSELIKIDKRLIDYVVVHELAHLRHMNHSKEFHNLVDLHLEGSSQLRKKLKNIRLFV
ncbi:DUF45 domain-containing protein [Sulfurimonas aquatica]|uniref:DUF45 domain-containing protein n=1 Tax=Sulfurimonas aquatica TaxID=2672570 RepID=A0A975B066_9BACT|nr:SprT family zinc-dependent metalloprotease [Sulfurimonas aquatica]QSZ41787.1 DUF45 domain-containing protein [Sulfurimonas aquatica]